MESQMTNTTENNKIFTFNYKNETVEMTDHEVKDFYQNHISEITDIFDGLKSDMHDGRINIPQLKIYCEKILEDYKTEFNYDGTCILDNIDKCVADAQNKLDKYLSVGHYIEGICEICKRVVYRFVCGIKD